MDKEKISSYIEYALSMIEENPETLEKAIRQNNVEVGVPNYVANLISKIEEIQGEEAIPVALAILSTIDKMILESGMDFSKEQRMALISKTIQRVIEVNPQIAEAVRGMASELDESQMDPEAAQQMSQENPEEEPMETEEQGVF